MAKEIENKNNLTDLEEKETKQDLELSSPWISHVNKLQAFFEKDPDVRVDYNDETRIVKLYVQGHDKAEALYTLIPTSISFGSEVLKIEVIPNNNSLSLADTFSIALKSNPLFSDAFEMHPEGCSNAFTYVMFEPYVVQYWNDNLGDPNGITSTLPQDLAKDIFMDRLGAMYSTDEMEGRF